MIVLDSGAFSAWQRATAIDIDTYVAFIKRHGHRLQFCITLDVIGDAEASYANHRRMKAAGLRPVPVFHNRESLDWLKRYLDDGEDHIALSPGKTDGNDKALWLADCFAIIGDGIRVHGLGLAAPFYLHNFPFTSVDARTWSIAAGNGQVPIPRYSDGQPDYTLPHRLYAATDRSLCAGRPHLDELGDFELDRVRSYLRDHAGLDLAQVRYDITGRWRAWLAFQKALMESVSRPFELCFVTNPTGTAQNRLLTEYRVPRLVSFFDLQNATDEQVDDFIAGKTAPSRPTRIKPDWSDRYRASRALGLYERVTRRDYAT